MFTPKRIICPAVLLCVTAAAAPKLELLDPQTANVGRYPARLKQETSFRIKNTGDAPLTIIRIRKTCGCFSVSCDISELSPKATATVKITVLPDSVHAPFTKSVFVESTDPATPCLRLNISGNAVPLITVRPKAKLSVGKLQSSTKWKQAFLLSASEKGVVLGEAALEGTHPLTTELSAQSAKPDTHRLVLRSSGKLAPGHFKCTVKIPIIEPAGAKPLRVVVYGTVAADQR